MSKPWHRHRIPEPETPVVPADPGPTYVEVADARRLLEAQMLRGRNKNDRTRARWLYVALFLGAA